MSYPSRVVYVIVWKYEVGEPTRDAFEREYGPEGSWVKFFTGGEGYLGTELLRSGAGVYLTIDRWESQAEYHAFRTSRSNEYERIDTECGALTTDETLVGAFEDLET